MTKLTQFIDNLETIFADTIEVIVDRGEMNPYYGNIEIKEGGETVVRLFFEEDKYGEGDAWDETYLIADFVDMHISEELLEYLEEHPLSQGVKSKYLDDLKLQFMLKGWHVK